MTPIQCNAFKYPACHLRITAAVCACQVARVHSLSPLTHAVFFTSTLLPLQAVKAPMPVAEAGPTSDDMGLVTSSGTTTTRVASPFKDAPRPPHLEVSATDGGDSVAVSIPMWQPPLPQAAGVTEKVDIWAVGCLLTELLTGTAANCLQLTTLFSVCQGAIARHQAPSSMHPD